ncbi:hypothetical protein OF83DRAFT_475597 [Amylostereum chailletii]|nr:hypothetical protein OF83DRAFT_475597 [Amylostereum chailletii]
MAVASNVTSQRPRFQCRILNTFIYPPKMLVPWFAHRPSSRPSYPDDEHLHSLSVFPPTARSVPNHPASNQTRHCRKRRLYHGGPQLLDKSVMVSTQIALCPVSSHVNGIFRPGLNVCDCRVHPREKKLYDAIKDAVLSTDPHGCPCRCYQRLRTVYASFSEYLEGDGALAQTTQVARPASEVLTEEFYCRLRRNTSMNNFVHDARRLPVDLPGSRSTDVRYTTPFNGPLADPTKGPLLKAELYQFQGPNRTLTGGVAWSHVNQSTVDHCTPELVGKYHGGRLVPSKGLPEGSRITDTIYCCVSDGPPLQT